MRIKDNDVLNTPFPRVQSTVEEDVDRISELEIRDTLSTWHLLSQTGFCNHNLKAAVPSDAGSTHTSWDHSTVCCGWGRGSWAIPLTTDLLVTYGFLGGEDIISSFTRALVSPQGSNLRVMQTSIVKLFRTLNKTKASKFKKRERFLRKIRNLAG